MILILASLGAKILLIFLKLEENFIRVLKKSFGEASAQRRKMEKRKREKKKQAI